MPIYRPQYRKFRGMLEETLSRFDKMSGRSKICNKAARILRFLLQEFHPQIGDVSDYFQGYSVAESEFEPWYPDEKGREWWKRGLVG
jgi:hypothetical protein